MKIDNLHAYEERTDAIISWTEDWLSSDEFDALALAFTPSKFPHFEGTDFLLPSYAGNPAGEYGDWIYLAQVMVDKGLLKRKHKAGVVYYKRALF